MIDFYLDAYFNDGLAKLCCRCVDKRRGVTYEKTFRRRDRVSCLLETAALVFSAVHEWMEPHPVWRMETCNGLRRFGVPKELTQEWFKEWPQ